MGGGARPGYVVSRAEEGKISGSIDANRTVKGGTNSRQMGSITPTPTAKIWAALTLTVL